MIHLDTGTAIHATRSGSPSAQAVQRWLIDGTQLAMSSIAWGELVCGPLRPLEEAFLRAAVSELFPVDAADAELAAQLFDNTGRRRGSFMDCVIAATAIRRNESLATTNVVDFEQMRPLGLDLIALPV
jgi:predicted nucleic acid-binding protein